MTSFIKNPEILREDYRVDDLLDFSDEIERLDDIIKQAPFSSLIGYIGKFGSGKSTAIYQLQKKYKDNTDTKWLEFDAWKYPERNDLWEGFTLDIAEQLGRLSHTTKKIDGKSRLPDGISVIAQIAERASVLPGLSFVVEKFTSLFKGQPIERVFEIQKVLCKLFSSLKEKDIFIVVEDLDRSGDAGRYFLETLRQFIKNNLQEKRIIVIVPIGEEIYRRNQDHKDTYQKVLDYFIFFQPKKINYSKFVDAVFDPKSFPENFEGENFPTTSIWRSHLERWFLLATQNHLTIREIKVVLREADSFYSLLNKKGYEPDPRIVLAFALLNHTGGENRLISVISKDRPIPQGSIISKYLQWIARNKTEEEFSREAWIAGEVHWSSNKEIVIPVFIDNRQSRDEVIRYDLANFYLLPY